MSRSTYVMCFFGLCLLANAAAPAQNLTVSGRIVLASSSGNAKSPDQSNSVVWLTPLNSIDPDSITSPGNAQPLRLVQKNKSFEPHVLIVPVGAAVEFPNRDPWFHNVFSLFEGKRFDLGLYEAGESRMVHFDRQGISYIFCNIHPQMSAVVIAVRTPFYGKSDRAGNFTIAHVPQGKYALHVWSEHALPEAMQSESRDVTISESSHSLGEIHLQAGDSPLARHKNKYGKDYDRQDTPSGYRQP